jgi:RNA polymerase sigma-70 factor (subfamily 1)
VPNITAGEEGDDESQWFESALRGDQEAFARLVQKYRPQLKDYLRSRICGFLLPRIDSSDVIQEVAMQGMGSAADYLRTLSPLRCLQLLVGHRLYEICRYHLDREKRDPRRERSLDKGDSSTLALAELLADSILSPAQSLLQAEKILMVHQALESMEEEKRQILLAVHYESLSHIRIAERLGISEEASRRRYGRALGKFGEIIQQLGYDFRNDEFQN